MSYRSMRVPHGPTVASMKAQLEWDGEFQELVTFNPTANPSSPSPWLVAVRPDAALPAYASWVIAQTRKPRV